MMNINLPKILMPFYCDGLIRLGKDNDGGYLANISDVLKSNRLISLGISDDISFEVDFVKFNDCAVDSYDDKLEHSFEFFRENKKCHKNTIGKNGVGLLELFDKNEENIFLKCDIEGAEYDILDEIIQNQKIFSGMVIEFHDINQYSKFNEVTNFIGKIKQRLIHIHVNNCSYIVHENNHYVPVVIELTFSSCDNLEYKKDILLPHELDSPNASDREEFKISFE